MIYNIIIEKEAQQDLDESALWYEEHSTGLGFRFLEVYLGVIDYLELHAASFPFIEGDYRQAIMKSFPFVIVYKISGSDVKIISVFHTGRNPEKKIK
ncbi:hypothetical protein LBMAG27_08180 [Bacteroidota bacterium]|nr:hypothetical protein LBMAG27_08180 [Bacteroidota bacterium]